MALLMRQLFRNAHRTFNTTLHKLADSGKLMGANMGEMLNHKRITSGFKYRRATRPCENRRSPRLACSAHPPASST